MSASPRPSSTSQPSPTRRARPSWGPFAGLLAVVLTTLGVLGLGTPPAAAAPLPPTRLVAIASPGSVRLTWIPPDDGSEVTGYRVTASTGAVWTVEEAPATLSPLPDGIPVSFRVAALLAGGGTGPLSAPSAAVTPRAAAPSPVWRSTGRLQRGRVGAVGVRLEDGTVLAIGGTTSSGGATRRSVERYYPATGRWTATGSLDLARSSFTATLLPDGRVLVTGGWTDDIGLRGSTRIYSPSTGRWTRGPRLLTPRAGHTATLLANGTVLVAGGFRRDALPVATRSAEIYHPRSNRWTPTGPMRVARALHSATRLPGGEVLAASGTGDFFQAGLRSSETYRPATGTWVAAGALQTVRTDDYVCCGQTVLLPDGRVLLAGSWATGGSRGGGAETFDPGTRRWTATGRLRVARTDGQQLLRLADGRVLAVGGADDAGSLRYAEAYAAGSGRWSRINDLRYDRDAPLAVRLRDGRVLVAGGAAAGVARRSSEVLTTVRGS